MNVKDLARQIKKELNAAFNNGKPKEQKVKFSVTSEHVRGIGYDEIKISWVGGAFASEVKELVGKYDTYVNYSDYQSDYFRATGTRLVYNRELSQTDVDFLTEYVLPQFPANYEVIFKKKFSDSEGFTPFITMDGCWVYRSDECYQMLIQYSETGAIAKEIPSYVWEDAWAAKKEKEAQQVESVRVIAEVVETEIVETEIVEEPTQVNNVVSMSQFKESKQQNVENDYSELADFLAEMPSDRRAQILKRIAESESPTIYIQSLLERLRSIKASGF